MQDPMGTSHSNHRRGKSAAGTTWDTRNQRHSSPCEGTERGALEVIDNGMLKVLKVLVSLEGVTSSAGTRQGGVGQQDQASTLLVPRVTHSPRSPH